jgi:hypothetical protein
MCDFHRYDEYASGSQQSEASSSETWSIRTDRYEPPHEDEGPVVIPHYSPPASDDSYQSSAMPDAWEEFREQGGYLRRGSLFRGFTTDDHDGGEFYAALTDGSDVAEAMQRDPLFSQDRWRQGVNELQRKRSDCSIAENTFLGAAIWANYPAQTDTVQMPNHPHSAPSQARGSPQSEPSQYQPWRNFRM